MSIHITDSEWYFDKHYNRATVDRLEASMVEPMVKRIDESEVRMRGQLDKNPSQNSVFTMEGGKQSLGNLDFSWFILLSVYRDNPNPEQCAIYVGRESWVERQINSIKAQLATHHGKPGIEGMMVEQEL